MTFVIVVIAVYALLLYVWAEDCWKHRRRDLDFEDYARRLRDEGPVE